MSEVTLSEEILDDIDGADESRGRDSKITAWAESAKRLEQQRDELLAALQLFIKQWNACGPNSDFGRYFSNVRAAAVSAIAIAEGAQ